MRKKFLLIIGLSLATLLTMGCGVCSLLTPKGRETTLTKVVEKQLSATPETPTPSSATKPTATKPAKETPAGDTLGTLGKPTSYRYKLDLEMSTGDQVNKMNGEGAYVQDPPAYELNMQVTEEGQTTTIRIIQVNNKAYLYDPERNGWMIFPAQEENATEMISTDDLVKQEYLNAFKLEKKSETVNGQDCQVYKANAQDLPSSTLGEEVQVTDGTVRVWIAKKLNMMVRYQADVAGKKADNTVVKMKMQMDLFDVNTAIKVEPPPADKILEDLSNWETPDEPTRTASKGQAAQLPKPSDATPLAEKDLETAQQMVISEDYDIYQTKLSVSEIAKFLEKAYDEAGWTKEEWSTVSDSMAILFFTKGNQTAQVTATGELVNNAVVVIVSMY